jgi:hypothetical protein
MTAVNAKDGNVVFRYQAYGTVTWHSEIVAKG